MDVGLVILFGFSGLLGALLLGIAVSIGSLIEERALAAPKTKRTRAAAGSSTPVAIATMSKPLALPARTTPGSLPGFFTPPPPT